MPSLMATFAEENTLPWSMFGRAAVFSLSPVSLSGFSFSVERNSHSAALKPSSSTILPFAEKELSPQSAVMTVSPYTQLLPTAQISRKAIRERMSRSPAGSSVSLELLTAIVGIMAWWSDTLLLSVTCSIVIDSSRVFQNEKIFAAFFTTAGVLLAISVVRNRLSVRG